MLLAPAIECIGAYTTKRNEGNILQPTKHGYFNQWLKWQFEVPRVQRSSGGYPSDPLEGVSWYLTQLYIWMPSNLHMGHQLVIWQFPSQQSEQIWDISWDAKSAWPTNPHRNSGSHGSVQSTLYTAWSIPATMQREPQERCDWCIWSKISKRQDFLLENGGFPSIWQRDLFVNWSQVPAPTNPFGQSGRLFIIRSSNYHNVVHTTYLHPFVLGKICIEQFMLGVFKIVDTYPNYYDKCFTRTEMSKYFM